MTTQEGAQRIREHALPEAEEDQVEPAGRGRHVHADRVAVGDVPDAAERAARRIVGAGIASGTCTGFF